MKKINIIIKYIALVAMIALALISIFDSKAEDIVSVIIPTILCATIYLGCTIKEKQI